MLVKDAATIVAAFGSASKGESRRRLNGFGGLRNDVLGAVSFAPEHHLS
jgi:hypothetical protein